MPPDRLARRDLTLVAVGVAAGVPDSGPARDEALRHLVTAASRPQIWAAVGELLRLSADAQRHHLDRGDVDALFAEAAAARALRRICADRLDLPTW